MFPYNNYYPYYQTGLWEQPESIFYQGRIFTRVNEAMPSSVWIERGPDGRPCYVKKKTAIPSLRNKFAEAFHEIRQRTQQPSSTAQHQPSAQTATVSTQSTSNTSNPKSQPDVANQNNQLTKNAQPQAQTSRMAYYPGHSQFQAFNPYQFYYSHGTAYNPYAAYQRPFPANPPGFPQLAQTPNNTNPTTQATTSAQAQPPATTAAQQDLTVAAQTNATKLATAQMAMNPDGLKFKCMICGRFRSSRYHLEHRLAPGQLPGPTICRRCRKHTTESEDETSDSEEDELLYRSRAAVRRRSGSRGRVTRALSKARSSSRAPKRREDFDYYAVHSLEDTSSESEDFPARPVRRQAFRSRKAIKGRSKSVRYVNEPLQAKRSKSKIRKIIYMQEPDDQSDSSEDEVEVRYIKQATENALVRSRPGTPAPPGLLRPHLDEVSQPIYVEQRVYYDEPSASFGGKSIPPPEFNSRNPYRYVQPLPAVQHYPPPGPPYYRPDHHLPMRGDTRSRSRGHFGNVEDPEAHFPKPFLPQAPTPPGLHRKDSKSQPYPVERRIRHFEEREKEQTGRTRSASRGRRRSIAERESSEQSEVPADDYDWYDAHGMKVRVREI